MYQFTPLFRGGREGAPALLVPWNPIRLTMGQFPKILEIPMVQGAFLFNKWDLYRVLSDYWISIDPQHNQLKTSPIVGEYCRLQIS